MKDTIISLRIDENLRNKMKTHEEVNWSAVLRRAIIENLENRKKVNFQKRKEAFEMMDRLRKKRAFDGEKDSTLIIREWRDKRH